ncbi:ribosome biogenesis GTPase Der [Christensenella sp. MSJ-20]|uniref:ribosome biogenesis GTPase Der n=1 Tax=Christensenella sp. MSJ-20 TaxID=2841518 RepID=UPI001C793A60|nr:ribosome biogenesis GTPase Der [Christensenella sp. MSJ-20]
MSQPMVAIVGRPNVGKSTLFNRIVGKRISIVEDTPGVTRDRIIADGEWNRHVFSLVDTGGIEPDTDNAMMAYMREQAQLAISMADVVVMMTDGKTGVTVDDHMVADLLRRSKKPVILCVNKVDNPQREDMIYEFYELGLECVMPVSATLGLGIGDLLDEITQRLPEPQQAEEKEHRLAIAVVGKPNAGKSSLTNAILGQYRTIVSDVPGTTRDAIDTDFTRDGQEYTIIDTAGMRRKRSVEEGSVERFAVIRAIAAVKRSDVTLIVIDGAAGLTEQDVKVAALAHEEGKACVLVINKWDLVEKDTYTMDAFRKAIYTDLAFMSYVPMVFISAKTGLRVNRIFDLITHVYGQSVMRISTGMLNEVLNEAIAAVEPPSDKGRRLKILYGTQVAIQPPTFVLFVNEPSLMHFSYQRYLENYFRKTFGFEGTPIRFIIRKRDDK